MREISGEGKVRTSQKDGSEEKGKGGSQLLKWRGRVGSLLSGRWLTKDLF